MNTVKIQTIQEFDDVHENTKLIFFLYVFSRQYIEIYNYWKKKSGLILGLNYDKVCKKTLIDNYDDNILECTKKDLNLDWHWNIKSVK